MKTMTTIRLNAFMRYSKYWDKVNEKCEAAMAAGDWKAASHYCKLMQVANNLGQL